MKVIKTDPRMFMHKANKQTFIQAGEMADEIRAVIYKYADAVPVALAIGVLEVVKEEIMYDQAD